MEITCRNMDNVSYYVKDNTIYRSHSTVTLWYDYQWIVANVAIKYGKFHYICDNAEARCCNCENGAIVCFKLLSDVISLCKQCANTKMGSEKPVKKYGKITVKNVIPKTYQYVKIEIMFDRNEFIVTEELSPVCEIMEYFQREDDKYRGCMICDDENICSCRNMAIRYMSKLLSIYPLLLTVVINNNDIVYKIIIMWFKLLKPKDDGRV